MREALGRRKSDEKARRRVAGQIGTPHALEDVRELVAILRVARRARRDRLAAAGHISNLADEQLDNVKALLDSPIGRHRDVFLYALLMVMSRLGSPWQLIRLAIQRPAATSRRASPRRRSRSRSISCSPTSSA